MLSRLPSIPYTSVFNQGIRTVILTLLLLAVGLGLTITAFAQLTAPGREPCPDEEPITVPGVEKRLIRMGPSRPGDCVTPVIVVMHNTDGGTLESNWTLFDENQRGGGQNAGFIIGEDGHILQTVEFYQTMAEITYTSNHMNRYAVSIEMVGPYIHNSKNDQPPAQYNAALNLVCFLMQQYNIPVGTTEADWVDVSESNTAPEWVPGIYGHYQIVPSDKEDPGEGWLADFREDLRAGNCGSAATGTGAGGRMVPYDAYARPYSWPITGIVKQDYGYTEEAQSLGARFPGMYPIGNPGTIFSTDNHDEQPIDPATAKYINPNIDITPLGNSTQARAVYATHAGWLTFADWAGPEKGYTIQIESDVEGDGQADMATRYMRLQAPQDGFFAPDIPITRLIANNSQSVGMKGECTVIPNEKWENVNRWDDMVRIGIAEILNEEEVEVPCNLVKAHMWTESRGIEGQVSPHGYGGLMQVGTSAAAGGGSNCDWQKYDINTTQGNINCGVQEMARGYKQCDNSWDGAILKYFSGQCTSTGADDGNLTTDEYLAEVKGNWQELDSYAGGTTTIPSLPAPNPSTENPEETETFSPPPFVLEGEHMTPSIDNGAEVVHDDPDASGGASMKLTTDVFINKELRQKADQLMIRAKSIKNLACVNQVDPELEVYVNNSSVGTITINSTVYRTFPLAVDGLDGSRHTLSMRLTNPGALLCNRALWIDSIHYVITNPNTPTVETVATENIEAEDIPDATEGDSPTSIEESKFASEGRYVAFTSNSKIEGEFELPEANYFTIRARADFCSEGKDPGVPILKISIDDEEFMTLGVDSEEWTEYSYKFLPGQSIANPPSTSPSTSTPPSSSSPPPSTGGNEDGDGEGDGSTDGNAEVGDGTGGAPLDPVQEGNPSVGDGTGGAPNIPNDPPSGGGQSNVQGATDEKGQVLQFVDPGGPGGAGDSDDDPGDGDGDGSPAIEPDDEDSEDGEEEEEDNIYKITIEFVNDLFVPGICDRNVYVDVLRFDEFQVTQAVYSKVSMIGKTKYVAYNQLIGYVSASRGSDVEFELYRAEAEAAAAAAARAAEDEEAAGDGSVPIEPEDPGAVIEPDRDLDIASPEDEAGELTEEEIEELKKMFYSRVPNANQIYLSYRIMYNNPNFTTFPLPIERDLFINAEVDNPYIVETDDNKVAGSLKTIFDSPDSPMFFFCALRQKGDNVRCIQEPNP